MHESTQLADRYVAIWHEPDAEQRRRGVAQLWAEDGVQFTSWGEMRGHQAIEKRIEAAYEEFVKTRGLLSHSVRCGENCCTLHQVACVWPKPVKKPLKWLTFLRCLALSVSLCEYV